jgi:hypothetical protein
VANPFPTVAGDIVGPYPFLPLAPVVPRAGNLRNTPARPTKEEEQAPKKQSFHFYMVAVKKMLFIV